MLLLFGGGSIHRNGVYDEVRRALGNQEVVDFGGVEPNPQYETLLRAAESIHGNGCDFILGVGGGSVIDAAKFLSALAATEEDDGWEALRLGRLPSAPIPNGAVLTLPATGSESNAVSVISNDRRRLKIPFTIEAARPRFAILDPSTMASLDRRQRENGVVDAFTHVLEQYLTIAGNTPIQYGFSETILETLIEWGPVLVEEDTEEARENIMMAANLALNGLIGSGVPQDWSTHMVGHAITALYGVEHARSLSMVMPALLRETLDEKLDMLARYGRRVWKIDAPSDREAAIGAIKRTADFFSRMGCPISIPSTLGLQSDAILDHLRAADQSRLGERGTITADRVRSILERAAA